MKTSSSYIIFILLGVIISSFLSGCLMGTESIMVDGLERSYSIHIPEGYDGSKPLPLVLVFHGGGGNANNILQTTGFNQKADEEGFLVVYPQGSGRLQNSLLTWNTGFCCGYAVENTIDDVAFIRQLIDHLQRHYPIDTKMIYATGISNGGMMTYLVGAELSDIFAAIAPVAASIGGQATEDDTI
ncbi:MAG: PHB depolymerase family esterase, partial [Candidatus Thermoplasmatota archaeon]|nr:PHB depolymerase family esterase [Candidatus Thermoplasmatota archaeon]